MAPKKTAAPEVDPYASLPDVPAEDPYVNMQTTPAATNPERLSGHDTMTAKPSFFSKAGLKEAGYRAAHAVLDLLPGAGGAGGGLVGGGLGIESGPGAIATAGAGAAAGGVLGEDAKLALERHIFPESKGWGPYPKSGKETAADLAKQGAIQGLSEMSGRLASRAISPVAKYFRETAAASARSGIKLLPSEAKGGAESYIEKFLKGSVLTAGKMERFRIMQNAQTKAAAEAVANKISSSSATPEEVGKLIQDGIKQHTALFRMQQSKMYGEIDKAVAEEMVYKPVQKTTGSGFMQTTKTVMQGQLEGPAMPSMAPLKAFAKEQLARLEQQKKVLDPSLLSASEGLLQNIMQSPEKVTFQAMADSRSDLLALTRKLDEALPGKQAGFAKKLASLADESMMKAAEDSKIPGLPDAIRNANDLTRETHEMYEQALVKKAVESKKPEFISRLLGGNNIGVQETKDLMKILPASARPVVQKQVVLDAMRQSVNRQTGVFNERKFAESIAKMGDERGTAVFGPNWKNIQALTEILSKINGPTGIMGGTGAALQNAAVLKNMVMATGETLALPLGMAGTGHYIGAAKTIALEWTTLNALATAITHPATAAKVIKAGQAALRFAPTAAVGAYEVGKGQTKAVRDLQAIRDKHAAQLTTPAR